MIADLFFPSQENRDARPRNSQDSNSVRAKSARKRSSNGSRSSSVSRPVHAHESTYLTSSRGRREPSLQRTNSDVGGREPEEGKDGLKVFMEGSQEQWIHRDKLAKIESEELHQAAILFQRRIGESKSSAGRGRSHDSQQSTPNESAMATSPAVEYSEPWPDLKGASKHHNDEDNDDERRYWDLRRPEEIAADDAAASIYSHPSLGKSASRIPISTASPVPIPGTGRDSRGPRSRAATDEDDDRSSRGRRASEPINTDQDTTTPSPSIRPGSRGFSTTQNTPAKKQPTGSTNRKTSAPPANRKPSAGAPRSRAVSGNTRPSTRGGDNRPPTAVNRPEGDPPWLATMYKPDPRLPPDQQMLPTLAKKMQQEQWEKEGRTPNTYDRNFAPLAVHPFDAPPVPSHTGRDPEPEQPDSQQFGDSRERQDLPPSPPKSPEPPRPPTSTGYSTMPRVQDPPPMGLASNFNSNWTPPVVSATEKPEKKKSCGCCIVM